MDYYPVIFPGFSWTNLQEGQAPLNQIPRRGGRFFWEQAKLVESYGLDMTYVAMFDEVDEGTTIMKVTNHPPVGRFATYEGLPSDAYLRLSGLLGKLMRGEQADFPDFEIEETAYRPQSQLEFYEQENPFPAEVTERWSERMSGVPVVLHEETFSPWISDLYNSGAVDLQLSSWREILDAGGYDAPLAVMARGDEWLVSPSGDTDGDAVAAMLGEHLGEGGVLLVLSGGRFPGYHPGGPEHGHAYGFRLRIRELPKRATVRFSPRLRGMPASWTPEKKIGSRLMHASDYPDAEAYESLAPVLGPDGEALGDLIAAVKPGGEFGKGTLIYVGSSMLEHPDRAAVLTAVLDLTSRAIKR